MNFSKYYIIQAPQSEVYRAITNSIALSMWTEEEAIMSEEVNSEFSLWGGNISGENLEFEIREGHHIIGTGKILEIVNPILKASR